MIKKGFYEDLPIEILHNSIEDKNQELCKLYSEVEKRKKEIWDLTMILIKRHNKNNPDIRNILEKAFQTRIEDSQKIEKWKIIQKKLYC